MFHLLAHKFYSPRWNWVSLYWLLWLVVGFLPMEMYALLTGHPENTLSDNVWHLAGLQSGHPWTFAHFFIAVFMIWLTFHFALGWFR